MKLSIVAEGGGMRGAYTLGVMDALYSHFGLKRVDCVTGSSAGTGTLAYYVAGQFYPGYYIWTRHVPNPRLISLRNIAKNRPILDIDYVIDEIFRKKIPLSIKKLRKSKMKFIIPLTNIETQKAEYFTNKTSHNVFEVLRAAMAVPFLYNKHIEINGQKYYDGSFSDPIPINIPEIKNSRKIVILTSNPKDHDALNLKMEKFLAFLLGWKLSKGIRKSLENRHRLHKEMLDKLNVLEKEGDIIIRPLNTMSRFDNRKKTILENINKGYQDTLSNKKITALIQDLKNSHKHYF